MEQVYFWTGVILFWILRIGLIGYAILLIIDSNVYRQNITFERKINDSLYRRETCTIWRFFRDNPLIVFVILVCLVLGILCWLTLLF